MVGEVYLTLQICAVGKDMYGKTYIYIRNIIPQS